MERSSTPVHLQQVSVTHHQITEHLARQLHFLTDSDQRYIIIQLNVCERAYENGEPKLAPLIVLWNFKSCQNLLFTMKVPDGSREWAMLAWANSRVSDGQAGMSKERDSADCECWRRLREHQRCGAIGFHEWWCLRQQACQFRYPCQNKRVQYYHADACLFYFYLFYFYL